MFALTVSAAVHALSYSEAVEALTPVERIQLASLLVNSAAADIEIERPTLALRVWRTVESLGRVERIVRQKLSK
jgi:hypothetical protein